MKIGGGSPFRNIRQMGGKSKTKKAGKSYKSSSLDEASEVSEVDSLAPAEAAEEVDQVFNDFTGASLQYEEDGDLEDATRAVVSSILREHLGNKNLSAKAVEQITAAVTSSVQGDEALSKQLESLLKRMTPKSRP